MHEDYNLVLEALQRFYDQQGCSLRVGQLLEIIKPEERDLFYITNVDLARYIDKFCNKLNYDKSLKS